MRADRKVTVNETVILIVVTIVGLGIGMFCATVLWAIIRLVGAYT